jgi:PAS domain S-box-containing protein
MAASAQERAPWPRLAVIALAAGAAASLAACWIARSVETRAIENEFKSTSKTLTQSLARHISAQLGQLDAVTAFWGASHTVERKEFAAFAVTLLKRGLEKIAWVPVVPAAERVDREVELGKDIGRDVVFHGPGGTALDPSRASFFPVWYTEPLQTTQWDFGLDLGSDKSIEPVVLAATRKNSLAARRAPPINSGEDPHLRLLAAQPIAASAEENDHRAAHLPGLVVGVFGVQSAVEAALLTFPSGSVADVLLWIASEPEGQRLAYQHSQKSAGMPDDSLYAQAQRRLHAEDPLTIGPLSWTVVCIADDSYIAQRRTSMPWVLLGAGLALSVLMASYIRSVEHRARSLAKSNAGLYTEIAERHAIDKELRETQRALATLVANLPGLAYRCRNDKDWSMEFISDGSIPLTGHPPADFLRNAVSFGKDVMHPDDRERVWNDVQQALHERRPFQINYKIVTAFGDPKYVWEQGRGVFTREGELLAIEGFVTDVTERKKTEDDLRRETAFARAIIESMPGNFYMFDERGKFLRWNKTVEHVSGYSAAEIERMSPLDFFAPETMPVIAAAVQRTFAEGSVTIEADLLTKSGTRLPYLFTGVRFEYEGVRMLIGLGLEASERNRAREERARLEATLLQTQKLESLGVLAAAIAHDFNNLLTVVMGNAGLAQRSLAPGSAAHDFIQEVLGASKNASHLTRKLRDYADLKSRTKEDLDVSAEVTEFRGLLRTSVPRTVRLEFELAPELPKIHADPAQVQQLLMNLVVNAAEAYDERNGVVRVSTGRGNKLLADVTAPLKPGRAVKGTARPGRFVFLEVADSGTGLDPTTLLRIGEPFFTTKFTGRGLGLAAVLGILREHDGWLEIESHPERGSTFRACVPIAPTSSNAG